MGHTWVLQIFLAFLAAIIIYIFYSISKTEATYVKSPLDNKEYLVQNLDNKEEAAHMLSIINQRIHILNNYLQNHAKDYPKYTEYIEQFGKRIKGFVLQENAPTGKYTSYTVNKGDEIALCLRSKKTGKLHNINLIMYVVLHELSDVACPVMDHTALFKKIFIFFIKIAIFLRIYKQEDYQSDPIEYCGLTINENLLK